MKLTLFAFVCVLITCLTDGSRDQCMSVRGMVRCPNDHSLHKYIPVQLIDKDRGNRDDLLDEGFTSKNGAFYLQGCAQDSYGNSIDPAIIIYHKCSVGHAHTKSGITVPDSFINKYTYNMTVPFDLSNTTTSSTIHRHHTDHAVAINCEED